MEDNAPALLLPMTILPSRSLISLRLVVSAKTCKIRSSDWPKLIIASQDILLARLFQLPQKASMPTYLQPQHADPGWPRLKSLTAMISLETVMLKPVSRVMPFSAGPLPVSIALRKRSLMSTTRFQVIVSGSISRRTNLKQQGLQTLIC